MQQHTASVLWDIPTQPAIYADDLVGCKGDCHQGRNACAHPLACAGIEAPSLRTDLRRVELANGATVAASNDAPELSTGMRLVLRVAALAVVSATAMAVWL
jgi:hypothetical protein